MNSRNAVDHPNLPLFFLDFFFFIHSWYLQWFFSNLIFFDFCSDHCNITYCASTILWAFQCLWKRVIYKLPCLSLRSNPQVFIQLNYMCHLIVFSNMPKKKKKKASFWLKGTAERIEVALVLNRNKRGHQWKSLTTDKFCKWWNSCLYSGKHLTIRSISRTSSKSDLSHLTGLWSMKNGSSSWCVCAGDIACSWL